MSEQVLSDKWRGGRGAGWGGVQLRRHHKKKIKNKNFLARTDDGEKKWRRRVVVDMT